MRTNEKALRKYIRGVLQEARVTITFDDGSKEHTVVSDSDARDLLGLSVDVSQQPDKDVVSTMATQLLGEAEGERPWPVVESAIVDIIGDTSAVPQVFEILNEFTTEDASLLRSADFAVGKYKVSSKRWRDLIQVASKADKVGKGEIAAALLFRGAKVDPGGAVDLLIGSDPTAHVKYFAPAKPKASLPYQTRKKADVITRIRQRITDEVTFPGEEADQAKEAFIKAFMESSFGCESDAWKKLQSKTAKEIAGIMNQEIKNPVTWGRKQVVIAYQDALNVYDTGPTLPIGFYHIDARKVKISTPSLGLDKSCSS